MFVSYKWQILIIKTSAEKTADVIFLEKTTRKISNINTIWRVIHKSIGSYPQKSRFGLWITQKLYQNLYPVQQDIYKNKRSKKITLHKNVM